MPCGACKRVHAERTPHKGSPVDWNAEKTNLAYYREVAVGFEQLLGDIGAQPAVLPWCERVAVAVGRHAGDLEVRWLTLPEVADGSDRVLYIAPPGTRAALRCGVALQASSGGRRLLTAPMDITSGRGEVLLLMSLTGCWLAGITYPPGVMSEEAFRALGSEAN